MQNNEVLKILAETDADAWIDYHEIKNEKAEPIEWVMHQFQIDIYNDQSQNLVVMKPAQVGLSTLEVLKNIRDADRERMDIVYTLPTDSDVQVFVGGKVNRIIVNNPYLEKLTANKDSVEQKQIGQSMIYFRGTWTKKAAIMVTADRLVHDEIDSSKQDVIADYQARLQHSKKKQTHVFSHPSAVNAGVDIFWQMSDQKEWFIKCPHCQKEQILTWNTEDDTKMSIDIERKEFICKKCKGVLRWQDRAIGRWRAKKGKQGAKWSGYHISLLMAPWMTAEQIIEKYQEVMEGKQTMDFFYNKVLGLPYAGDGTTVTEDMVREAIVKERNLYQGRMVIGVDTGIKLRYVYGNSQGLLGYGEMDDYMPDAINKLPLEQTLEYFLKRFPESIMVIDQGGDIIGSRKLRAKYPGRVFLCHYARDRKTFQLVRWGKGEEFGNVVVDRNRMIQLLVDEWKDKRIRIYRGTFDQWRKYWLHWSHIYRVTEKDESLDIPIYIWKRSDRDDWVHATLYYRVGISQYGGIGGIVGVEEERPDPNSYLINPNNTLDIDPHTMFGDKNSTEDDPWWASEENDWRNK